MSHLWERHLPGSLTVLAYPGMNLVSELTMSGAMQHLRREAQLIHPLKDDSRTAPKSDRGEGNPIVIHSIEASVLDILESVSGTSEVRENPDLALFDQHILDSFDLMRVVIELSDTLHIEISPAEVEREAWSTPRKIVAYMQNRISQQ